MRPRFTLGSSPRLRGTRRPVRHRARADRFIPAPAGNTAFVSRSVGFTPVHPRACGEHLNDHAFAVVPLGSSQRLRGTPKNATHAEKRVRFIPAPAGNTICSRPSWLSGTVHPRACGEHVRAVLYPLDFFGSSPRLRGTRRSVGWWRAWCRFIPAPAGNTVWCPPESIAVAVHPRACGEHVQTDMEAAGYAGSSPRLRGTPERFRYELRDGRFIPAPAGNTPGLDYFTRHIAVHPRACGEHFLEGVGGVGEHGSSPRLRGTPPAGERSDAAKRFIPAPAGNTDG